MYKCWQHDPVKRPRFADLVLILLDVSKTWELCLGFKTILIFMKCLLNQCKPEQVQTVVNFEDKKRDMLQYTIGEVITVLDKT